MQMGIKTLNEYCRLHNFSIRYNRQRMHNGFNTFDYTVR